MSIDKKSKRDKLVNDIVANILNDNPTVTPAVDEPAADAVEPAAEPVALEATDEPAVEPTEPVEPVAPAALPEPVKPMYFGIIDQDLVAKHTFRRGFETVLIEELKKGPGTIDEVTNRLLASGEYQRVAPRAAELRPTKPTAYLLKLWVSGKMLGTFDTLPEVAAEAASADETTVEPIIETTTDSAEQTSTADATETAAV